MKPKIHYYFIIFISLFFLQCSPQLNYLGSNYKPTENVELYFDAKEIVQEYTTMGLLNFQLAAAFLYQDDKYLSNLIIQKAKKVGADAVIVTRFSNEVHQELDENINIEAKFIKFED